MTDDGRGCVTVGEVRTAERRGGRRALTIVVVLVLGLATACLLPVALSSALTTTADLLQPAIIRSRETRLFLLTNVGYAGVFAVCVLVMSSWWGLLGFAWATVVARARQFLLYLMLS